MPAPVPYNGQQSRLEYYAINGNPIPGSGPHAGLGRPVLITQTKLLYGSSFKNPTITNNVNDQYGLSNTNALSDAKTPYRGKGTGAGLTNGNFTAAVDYKGGDGYDIDGGNGKVGSSIVGTGLGRSKSLGNNLAVWGYSPTDATNTVTSANNYKIPNTKANVGQVII
jgi:hypothetical protein